jgi:hypothetical protein
MLRKVVFAGLNLVAALVLGAAELGVGSPRDEVIAQLGAPKSKLAANGREILGYANGRITLVDGKVAEIAWKGTLPAASVPVAATPVAVARPSVPAASITPVPRSGPRDVWFTDFAAAQAEAVASKRRLLVLFTGSDWCPACIEFEANVAHAEDILNVTRAAFVLVRLDYPHDAPQSPALRAQNEELRTRYGVGSYPSLLVISADGAKSSRVNNEISRPADGALDYYVQAVDEARRAKPKSSFWPW